MNLIAGALVILTRVNRAASSGEKQQQAERTLEG